MEVGGAGVVPVELSHSRSEVKVGASSSPTQNVVVLQAVCPESGWKEVPMLQDTHGVVALESSSTKPAGHARLAQNLLDPAGTYKPVMLEQSTHSVELLTSWSVHPAGHMNSSLAHGPVLPEGKK